MTANSAQIGLDVAKTADIAQSAARLAETTRNFVNIGSQTHKQVGNALAGNALSASVNNFAGVQIKYLRNNRT
nr:hypothetical protein [uncultured Desulfobacter sp.]